MKKKMNHPPFLCNRGFPCVIFQKITKKITKIEKQLENCGITPPPFSLYTAGGDSLAAKD